MQKVRKGKKIKPNISDKKKDKQDVQFCKTKKKKTRLRMLCALYAQLLIVSFGKRSSIN